MLAGAAVFVVAAIAVGVVLVTGDDSDPSQPSTTVADSVFPEVSSKPEGGADKRPPDDEQAGGEQAKQPQGGNGGGSKPVTVGGKTLHAEG